MEEALFGVHQPAVLVDVSVEIPYCLSHSQSYTGGTGSGKHQGIHTEHNEIPLLNIFIIFIYIAGCE